MVQYIEKLDVRTMIDNLCNIPSTVGNATTNDATRNECYNEQFLPM